MSSESWYDSSTTSNETTGLCENRDLTEGVTDSAGYNCANPYPSDSSYRSYDSYPSSCGNYDDMDFNANGLCCACGGGYTKFPSYLLRVKFHYSEGSEQGTEVCESCEDDDSFEGKYWTSCDWYDLNSFQCGKHDLTRRIGDVPHNATTQCCGCRDVERFQSIWEKF